MDTAESSGEDSGEASPLSQLNTKQLLLNDGCVFGILEAVDVVLGFLFRLITGAGAVTSCEFLVSSWPDRKSGVRSQRSEILARVAGSLEAEREGSEAILHWLLISRAQLGWTACATQGAEATGPLGCLHVSEARA